jgi:glycosyltransferase involved in cell wall biosynthesis
MRILYCNKYNFPFSGTEIYLFDLMRLMRDQGHEATLFSMADARGTAARPDPHSTAHVDFKDPKNGVLRKIRLAGHAVYSIDARRKIQQMIQQFRPDIAHVRNIYHHLSPSILWELKRQKVPVIYHLNDFKLLCPSYNMVSNGSACERCRGGQFWRVVAEGCYSGGRAASAALAAEAYVHRWLRTYQKCVDRFLVPSQFARERLIENGWERNRIEVLPHFQRIPEQVPATPISNAPILYFGRLSPEKGVEDLLRALRKLPQIRANIAGDGPIRSQLEKLAHELGLSNVSFLGHVHGVALEQLVAEARFTVLPSHAYETLGKTILESYAQGRAVIASDLGSRREFVRHGETGLLYPVSNVEQLSMAIAWLCEHPEIAAEMGSGGREFVRKYHAPETHYQAMTCLYETLAHSPRSGPYRYPEATKESPRLRVAFIGARGVIGKYSGIEGYYEEVGRRLADAGHEITVYCRTYFTPPGEQHNGMRLVRLPTVRSKHLETLIHTLLSTAHVLFQPSDIVHYHALGPSLFSFVPRLLGKKTVATVQGLDWQRKKWNWLAAAVLRLGEKAAVRFPNRTMVVSRTLQSYYRRRYGVETEYIANGSQLRERRESGRIRHWGLEPEQYVLFLGRFSPEKNCHLLIEAYERLDTDVALVLAGGSSFCEGYTKELQRHASDHIHFLGYVSGESFDELLTNAMLLVLPSDMEGLSLALLEAMAAGLCVLASDIPENVELVDGAGFTFKRGDVADLERMLRQLIADGPARELAGRRARRRIEQQYQWPKIAAQVERVYLDLLGLSQEEASFPSADR